MCGNDVFIFFDLDLNLDLAKIKSHYDAEVGALKTELKELKQTVNGNKNSINDHYQKLTSRTMDVYFIFGLSDHMTDNQKGPSGHCVFICDLYL